MATAVEVVPVRDADGCALQLFLREPGLAGKRATLVVVQRAKVKRGSPVHHEEQLLRREIVLQAQPQRVALGEALDDAFAYTGDQLDLVLEAKLTIDDGVLFDTTLDLDLAALCRLPPRRARSGDAKAVHSPRDRFDFVANLRALPAAARAKILWLLVLGVPVIAGNALVGVRDEFVPESRAWFYDHRASDGESESPLMKALAGSGALGAAIWAMIAAQLRRYMTFDATLPAGRVGRDTRWQPARIVSGVARVPLQQVTLRLVAYNREHGQYTKTEKSGKRSRTVTKNFSNDAGGVVLYERLLAYVPAGVGVETYLDGDAELRHVFEALYPPRMLGGSHGLTVHFEVQLLHPEYVDQEVVLDSAEIDVAEFYAGGEGRGAAV